MSSFELKLHKVLVSTGMAEDKATELAEVLSAEINTRVSKSFDVATKSDVTLVRKDIENVLNQIRTLQWLFGAVGIPILVAIFMQFFTV